MTYSLEFKMYIFSFFTIEKLELDITVLYHRRVANKAFLGFIFVAKEKYSVVLLRNNEKEYLFQNLVPE